jgi:hypothetical protein
MDDASGTNKIAITGATVSTYTLVTADEGKFIKFEVTPHAASGTLAGAPTSSSAAGPVLSAAGIAYSFPKNCGDNQNMRVEGQIRCNSILLHDWLLSQNGAATLPPDYVFSKENGYKLPELDSVARFIENMGHLPEVPSAAEMQKEGLDLTQFNMVLLKKIEELTLYTIELKKRLDKEEMKLKVLESK